MNSLSEIRGLLQQRALSASGFPASSQIKYEGLLFSPTKGVPWARMSFLPASKRPFSISGGSRMDVGIFQVDLYFPPKMGTKTLDDAIDALLAAFAPGENLTSSSHSIWVNYADRGPTTENEEGVAAFVRVSWRCHSDD